MRITFNPSFRQTNQGYILLVTLVTLGICLVLLGSMMYWVSTNARQTIRNESFTTAEAGADADIENVVATMDRDFVNQGLNSASYYAGLVPSQTGWPVKFQFSDGSGGTNATGFTISTSFFTNQLGSQFANLSGYVQDCTITCAATPLNQTYNVSATVQEHIYATIIPLFQFAVFYNMNLEIDPGAAMNIVGAVFSNQGIWAGTGNVDFYSTVAAVTTVNTTGTDPFVSGKTDDGTPTANFLLSGNPISHEDSLTMPIGTNNDPSSVEGIINLPPVGDGGPNAYAYTTNGQIYLFNDADLIISNSSAGLSGTADADITIWYQNSYNGANTLTKLSPDVTNIVAHTSTNYFFSFVTNVQYYDYRESDTVQAVQLDVGKLNTWLTNKTATGGKTWNSENFADKGNGINTVFIYNNVNLSSTQLPAVRLVDGAQLPYTIDPNGTGNTTGGLTVVTPQPLYVEGNYNVQTNKGVALASAGTTNTANTYPAAIMGDAITILSSNWSDSYTSTTALSSRNPSATTVNAACLEGIVQSTNSVYSGGLENFLRLEENWGGTVTYNGSIVVMFPSIYATGSWLTTGNYYNAPTRKWAFDYNFTDPAKLPAHTPKINVIIRHSWTSY